MFSHAERAVLLQFGADDICSGFLITPRHVLTVNHRTGGMTPVGTACRIRFMPIPGLREKHLVVDGKLDWADAQLDLGVVRLDHDMDVHGTVMQYGELTDTRPLVFNFTGFPEVAQGRSKAVAGQMSFVPGGNTLDLDYDTAAPIKVDMWGGVSGSMVFHGDVAVGVVRAATLVFDKKFCATPVSRLFGHAAFKTYWTGQGQTVPRPQRLGGRQSHLHAERNMRELLAWCDRSSEYRTIARLASAPAGPARVPQPRLFALAGHADHCAVDIVPRLVRELQHGGANVHHIALRIHPEFSTAEELARTVLENGFPFDLGLRRTDGGAVLATAAVEEKWDALVVSAPFDSAVLGPRETRKRLDAAAAWLDTLADFPCPIVLTLILRWREIAKPGWIKSLLGQRRDPLKEVELTWSQFSTARGPAGHGAYDLCALEGYLSEDVTLWLGRPDIQASLHDCAVQIESQIAAWYSGKERMNFIELNQRLSQF